jgi:hypothetical protein
MGGSDNDFIGQGYAGIAFLVDEDRAGRIQFLGVETMSVHGVHDEWREFLGERHRLQDVDIIVAGAGMAAHLPGMIDAVLGHALKNQLIHVVGVAFEDRKDPKNTLAAELSISQVPDKRLICFDDQGQFTGPNGFLRASQFAAWGDFPALGLPKPRQRKTRSGPEALAFILEESAARSRAAADTTK